MDKQQFLFDMPKNNQSAESDRQFRGEARLHQANRSQIEMQFVCLDDQIPVDHSARQVWAYVNKLDLSKKLKAIKSVEGNAGRPAIDPKILVSLWLYATIEGIGSAHVLAQYTKEHLAFRWICGGVAIERRTISQFRIDNSGLFDDLLAQGVAILVKAGAIIFEEVAQDGLRVRASAGRGSFRREKKIQELHILAKEHVKALKAELEEDPGKCKKRQETDKSRAAQDRLDRLTKAEKEFENYKNRADETRKRHKKKLLTDKEKEEIRISTTDPEARIMKMADGGFRPAYNVQIAVETKKNIIVGIDVVNAGTDGGQIRPMYNAITSTYGKSPKRYLADGGFKSVTDVEYLTKNQCEVFMPVQERAKKGQTIKDPYQKKANESEEMGAWRIRMGKEESKMIYKNRAATVELANANMRHFGLYQVVVRGVNKVKQVAGLFAVTYNMMRTFALGII